MWRFSEFAEDREFILEEYDIDPDPFNTIFEGVTESLRNGEPYYHVFSSDSAVGRPDGPDEVDSIGIAAHDRGYVAAKVMEGGEWADYAIFSFERHDFRGRDSIQPMLSVRVARFEYDELPDPSASPQSRNQFYFDVVSAVDRRPEEMVEGLGHDFTPDYRLPAEYDSEYGHGGT